MPNMQLVTFTLGAPPLLLWTYTGSVNDFPSLTSDGKVKCIIFFKTKNKELSSVWITCNLHDKSNKSIRNISIWGNMSVSIATARTWCWKENGCKPHVYEDIWKYWSNINDNFRGVYIKMLKYSISKLIMKSTNDAL